MPHIFKFRLFLGLVLVFQLFLGLTLPTQAADIPLPQWRDTGLSISGNGSLCFDGRHPSVLFEATGSGTFAYNWVTGQRTQFNSEGFAVCNPQTGFFYVPFDTSKGGAPCALFTSDDPALHTCAHFPSAMASDGSLQVYSVDGRTPNLYASSDGGLTWLIRSNLSFVPLKLTVSASNHNILYALGALPDNNSTYLYESGVYFSRDGGATWEKRADLPINPDGWPVLSSPDVNHLFLVRRGGAGHGSYYDHTLISLDGGRTFGEGGWNGSVGWDQTAPVSKSQTFLTNAGLVQSSSDVYNPIANKPSTYTLTRSTDGGHTWQPVALPIDTPKEGWTATNVPTLLQSPHSPSTLFLQTQSFIWLSLDNAQSWQKISAGRANVLVTPYAPTSLISIDNNRLQVLDIPAADRSHTAPVADVPGSGENYYPLTHHSISPLFQTYWQTHGGLAQFGYPTTQAFREYNPTDGKLYTVQYFERNRFEYHAEYRGTPYEVLLGLLGSQLTQTRRGEAPFLPIADPHQPDQLYFAATGHTLAPQFKVFWQANGGLPVYGYPLSEPFQEVNPDDGQTYLVQYFERNRFEYHPLYKGTAYEVLLGLLGNTILKARGWL